MSNIAGLFHPWEREPERGGWREGEGRRNGGRSADPSASLHPRLSATLIFLHGPRSIIPRHIRPLSSLFPPCLRPALLESTPTRIQPWASSQATDCSFQIHQRSPCRRFARVLQGRRSYPRASEGEVGLLWPSRALFCGIGIRGRRCRLSAAINTRAGVNDLGDRRR